MPLSDLVEKRRAILENLRRSYVPPAAVPVEEQKIPTSLMDKRNSILNSLRKPTEQLDIKPPTADPVVKPEEKSIGSRNSSEFFYNSNIFAGPIQGVSPIPSVWSPALAAKVGSIGYGPKPEGGWSEEGVPLDKDGKPYYKPEAALGHVGEMFKGLSTLVGQPMETVKGLFEAGAAFPGFLAGLFGAAVEAGREIIDQLSRGGIPFGPSKYLEMIKTGKLPEKPFGEINLLEIYNAAARGLHAGTEFFIPGQKLLIKESTPESRLVGEVAFSPVNALAAIGYEVRTYEGFKDYPNIQGAAGFIADLLALGSFGFLIHGAARKAEVTGKLESVVRDADTLRRAEMDLNSVPESVLKQAQRRANELKKKQLDLRAKEIADSIAGDVLIREEEGRMQEALAREKQLKPDKMREVFKKAKRGRPKKVVEKPVEQPKRTREEIVKEAIDEIEETLELPRSSQMDKPIVREALAEAEKDIELPPSSRPKRGVEERPQPPAPDEFYPTINDTRVRGVTDETFAEINDIGPQRTVREWNKTFPTIKRYIADTYGPEALQEVLGYQKQVAEQRGVKHPSGTDFIYAFQHFKDRLDLKKAEEASKPILAGEPERVLTPEEAEIVSDLKKVKVLEDFYGREIKNITDAEIESFIVETGQRWFEETVVNADKLIGTDVPVFEGKTSPFFKDKRITNRDTKLFAEREKSVHTSPELMTQKLINDVNRWYHGDKEVNITDTKNALRELAMRADEVRNAPDGTPYFIAEIDRLKWVELVSDASEWASKLERPKPRTKPSLTQLNTMIPIDGMPRAVIDYIKKIQEFKGKTALRYMKIFRNHDLWKKTGFWMAKDGKWRFEIPDRPSDLKLESVANKGSDTLGNIYKNDILYKAFPELRDVEVKHDRTIPPGNGYMTKAYTMDITEQGPVSRTIDVIGIGDPRDANSVFHELQHIVAEKTKSSFRGANAEAVRREFGDEGWIYEYFTDPGEMEARLASERAERPLWRKGEPPWVSLDILLEKEGKVFRKSGIAYKGKSEGTKLYSGVPIEDLIKAAKEVSDYTRKARGFKEFKPKAAIKALRDELNRAVSDRSSMMRRELLEVFGEEGYEVMQTAYLSKGASPRAARALKQMRKEVYKGLSKDMKKILDDVILARRMITIASYKSEKQFKFPKGLEPEKASLYNDLFQYEAVNGYRTLTEVEVAKIRKSADNYREWMQKVLKDQFDEGLISEKEYQDLSQFNYRKIKLVDIFDKSYKTTIGGKRRTVYDSGVEALARGRTTDIYEPSSEIMALEVFNRVYGRIMNNRSNTELLSLARNHPDNPYAMVKTKGGPKVPSGWTRLYAFEKGERQAFYVSPEVAKEWIISNPELSHRVSQLIRYSSGSPILRTFATGINWGFALANLPRDVMHVWYAARVYDKDKWKPVYSSNLPVFAWQITKDLSGVFTDAMLRRGRYDKYIEQGGGMEFLVHQGRLLQRGRHLEGPIDAVYNFMGYLGETSEILTRLAVRDRVIRMRAREKGMTFEQAANDPRISREATFAARDYMDYGQGGWAIKAADNAFPYLNATVQGSRGLFRAFRDNPAASAWKLTQFASVVTGLYIAMRKHAPEATKALQGNVDMQNNLVIPLGDSFWFEDEKGQKRYMYLKIPLDPGQKFFKTFFEAATDKWLGNPVDVNRVSDSLKEMSPVSATELPPTVSAVVGYVTNKDFWLNEDIWKQTDKPAGWQVPKAITGKPVGGSEEEYIPGVTPEAMIDLGAMTGLSPERVKYAVEELTTSGTMWSYLVGKGYDSVFGNLPQNQKEQHMAMALSKVPIARRFFGVTNPYSQYAGSIEKAKEESDLSRWVENRGLDTLVDGNLYQNNVSAKEITDYISKFDDPNTRDRLIDRYKFQVKIQGLPNRSFWLRLKGLDNKARAKVWTDRFDKAAKEEQDQLLKETGLIMQIGGVVTEDFKKEVFKIRQEQAQSYKTAEPAPAK